MNLIVLLSIATIWLKKIYSLPKLYFKKSFLKERKKENRRKKNRLKFYVKQSCIFKINTFFCLHLFSSFIEHKIEKYDLRKIEVQKNIFTLITQLFLLGEKLNHEKITAIQLSD